MAFELPTTMDEWALLRSKLQERCASALNAVFSLVDHRSSRGVRDLSDFTKSEFSGSQVRGNEVRPTATAHLILALADLGVQFEMTVEKASDNKAEVKSRTSSGIVTATDSKGPNRSISYITYLHHFLLAGFGEDGPIPKDSFGGTKSSPQLSSVDWEDWKLFAKHMSRDANVDATWAHACLRASGHFQKEEPYDHFSQVICIGHLLHAVQALLLRIDESEWIPLLVPLRGGCFWLIARLICIVDAIKELVFARALNGDTCQVLEVPAYLLHACSAGLNAAEKLISILAPRTGMPSPSPLDVGPCAAAVKSRRSLLAHLADRQVHRMMARRGVPGDAEFDIATLIFALRARKLCNATPYAPSFLSECLSETYGAQLTSGCWPDGFSIDVKGWISAPLPSVEIGLALASIVFDRTLLTLPTSLSSQHIEPAKHALKALLPFCEFLENSRLDYLKTGEQQPVKGWSNDRKRSHLNAESWITASACRVFHLTYLLSEACARAEVLGRYNARYIAKSRDLRELRGMDQLLNFYNNEVPESDQIAKPATEIRERFLEALGKQEDSDNYIIRTSRSASSFILFGPPGSGKTYLMESIARSIGWPLIELSPGDFTRHGDQRFEETSERVFRDLTSIFHAVVLFDECDELFRKRPKDATQRNVFSFVTASMLPKLQRLHDDGSILFIVATNYLANIDDAVRRPGRFDGILLLDRPDSHARARFITSFRERFELPPLAPKDAKRIVYDSGGASYSDLVAVSRTGAVDKRLSGSRSDYVSWWRDNGEAECQAAGLISHLPSFEKRIRSQMPGAKQISLKRRAGLRKREKSK